MAIHTTLTSLHISLPYFLSTALILFFAYCLSVAVYRLYFHPLASYPGPFWARLTTWPSYLATLKQERHIWLFQLQDKYGPVFRYRPDALLINTPEGYKSIFGPKGNVKKTDDFYRVYPVDVRKNNTWNVTDLAVHARKRRVLNNAFSDRALRSAERLVHKNVDRWLDILGEEVEAREWSTKGYNMAHQVNYLVFDILGDLCFGKSFNMMEADSKLKHVPELMSSFVEFQYPVAYSPFAHLWVWLKPRGLDWLLTTFMPKNVKEWIAFVGTSLAERTKKEEEDIEKSKSGDGGVKDFYTYLAHARDPETGEKGYTLDELYGEAFLLIIAGVDTTATILAAMSFYLSRNQTMQQKLFTEIHNTFSSYDEIVVGAKLYGCKYLKALINETLRMAPPVPGELPREVLSGGNMVEMPGGATRIFPPGVQVSTSLYCLSYNKDIYAEPFKFRPERWIVRDDNYPDGGTAEEVALAENGVCAFSTGTRGCIGKNLAWQELLIVFAKLMWRFEIRQDPSGGKVGASATHPDVFNIKDAFVALRDGPVVQFRKRD